MKKRVAIQTLALTNNYGGILQAFALQYILEAKNFDVVHLNRVHRPIGMVLRLKISISKVINYFFYETERKVNRSFASFIQNFTNRSVELYSKEEWNNYIESNKFHAVVVGSDQVWRMEYIKEQYPEFFLDFKIDNMLKIAYAPSFGVSTLENYPLDVIEPMLRDFDALSVREDEAVALVKKHFNLHAKHVLDPTLLLLASDYQKIFTLQTHPISQLFCYILDKNMQKQVVVDEVALRLGLKKHFVYGASVSLENYKDPDILNKPTISEWLELLMNSQFVVTDSFHGMLFSVLFNKQFLVLANTGRGLSRFSSFLKLIGCEDRLISPGSSLNLGNLSKQIDYKRVNLVVNELRADSIQFLTNALSKK